MPVIVRMPAVAANATHAVLQNWVKEVGEAVLAGECLAQIETDKAFVEINAELAGVLARQLVVNGAEVEIGAPIGIVLAPGEEGLDMDALLAQPGAVVADGRAELRDNRSVEVSAPVRHESPAVHQTATRVFASPLARRLAAEHGIALGGLTGSGPNGRIVKIDVELATRQQRALDLGTGSAPPSEPLVTPEPVTAHASSTAFAPRPALSPQGLHEVLPASAMQDDAAFQDHPHTRQRQAIARTLSQSKATVPHFYLRARCRVDRLLALRGEANTRGARRISVNDLIVKAAACALREVPAMNVIWTEQARRQFQRVDIAVAVATEAGLVTPVVRDADRKPLATLSEEIADLATRARAGRLRQHELEGGSFSVSNLGMFGTEEFTAIINPPQSAILAVGAAREEAVAQHDQVIVARAMQLTLSVDHRVIDGAVAAQWLAAMTRMVENPLEMLLWTGS